MRDVELYQNLLGLRPPWVVTRVELSTERQCVDVFVEHAEGLSWPCPKCGVESSLHDHEQERVWRHLDSCEFKTFLHARPPRVKCATHNVRQVRLPWAEPNARFTPMFEMVAIRVLRETNVTGAARVLRVTWDEAWHFLDRAVERGLAVKEARVIPRLSVDEKSVAKGHRYFTIVCDAVEGTVEYVGEDRRKGSLDAFYRGLSQEQLVGIEAVSMDMWEPFISSTLEHVPDARKKIVFDRFHIMKHVTEAVDQVRRREHRRLAQQGNDALAGSRNLWLYAEENLPEKHRERFATLQALNLKTGRAWALKESLRELWEYKSVAWARRHWARWYAWAMRSRLPPMKEAARMIHDHLANVLTFVTHRLTTATSEGLNSKIEMVKKRAYGFRNVEHFKTAILFHCGGLQLYPAEFQPFDLKTTATHGLP